MATEKKVRQRQKATVPIALIPILALIVVLGVFILKFEQDVHIPLVLASIIATTVAVLLLGCTWSEIEEGILRTINMGMQAMLILMIIGILIGTWIASGIVPTLIYFGLKLINPSIFLAITMIICSVVSLATGSSWTTAGTVGVALIGVGQGIGIPAPMAAGAIISGAYFGDKMSPLSDTTNLAPAMAGATLFDHIKHMIYTTGPSYIIAFTLYVIIGISYAGKEFNLDKVNDLMGILENTFRINPLLLVPPLLVILMVVFKIPAIPGLIGGAALGVIFALIFQDIDFQSVMNIAQNGYVVAFKEGIDVTEGSSADMIQQLLNRGGLLSMMWTIALIICALTFGGIMESTGMLEVLAEAMLKLAVNTGSLVAVTVVSSIFINIVAGDQYLSIVIPGRMYKDAFSERHLAPRNLSRTLEDAGTLTSPLVPWNTCGAFMQKALGVDTADYLRWCFLNLINPLISILWAFLGFFQLKMTDEEIAEYEASKAQAHAHV